MRSMRARLRRRRAPKEDGPDEEYARAPEENGPGEEYVRAPQGTGPPDTITQTITY